MATIMTDTTSPEEIYRRYADESMRCIHWSHKRCSRKDPQYEKLDMSDGMARTLRRFDFNFVGYVPWTSPVNGDRWYAIMDEVQTEYQGRPCINTAAIPIYMWETIGSFGFVQWMQIWDAGDPEPGHTHYGVFMFTSHCMQRLADRAGLRGTPMQTVLFNMAVLNRSIIYVYRRGKQGMMAEIANQFGVFRIPYHDRTDLADIVKTFLTKEQLSTIDRKRYDKMWQRATTEIFGHWQMSMPANVLPNK